MPFKSDSQRRWMYAKNPAMARRWQKETPKGDLPDKVSKAQARANVLNRKAGGK